MQPTQPCDYSIKKNVEIEKHTSSVCSLYYLAKWNKIDMFSSLSWQVEYRTELRPVNGQEQAVLQGFLCWWSKWLLLAVKLTDRLSLRQYFQFLSKKGVFLPSHESPIQLKPDKNSTVLSIRRMFSNNKAVFWQENNAVPRHVILKHLNEYSTVVTNLILSIYCAA